MCSVRANFVALSQAAAAKRALGGLGAKSGGANPYLSASSAAAARRPRFDPFFSLLTLSVFYFRRNRRNPSLYGARERARASRLRTFFPLRNCLSRNNSRFENERARTTFPPRLIALTPRTSPRRTDGQAGKSIKPGSPTRSLLFRRDVPPRSSLEADPL